MLNFIAGIFVGFTWYLWIPFILFSIFFTTNAYRRNWAWTTVCAAFIACIFAYLHFDALKSSDTWLRIAKNGGIYLGIGFVWGIVAWTAFIYEKRKSFNEVAARWESKNPKPDDSDEAAVTNWRFERLAFINMEANERGEYIECYNDGRIVDNRVMPGEGPAAVAKRRAFLDSLKASDLAPHPKNNKERIAFDIVWWPMSILSMVLSDLPEKIWNTITRIVSSTYQMISGWIFGSAKI